MSTAEWVSVINQAAESGADRIQLIGGEPTLHPGFPILLDRVLDRGMEVEVFTNLLRVNPALWDLFERPGVMLATSYYSPNAQTHDAITRRRGSHGRTLANIRQALAKGITLRASVIEVQPGQDVEGAAAELRSFGVRSVGTDRLRQIGRGVRDRSTTPTELCGRCADGKLAVLPSGQVTPCLLSRWVILGSVRTSRLGELYERSYDTRAALVAATGHAAKCGPDDGGVCEQPTCMPHYAPPR